MKKVFVFLPDGVGLRNFVFSGFHAEAQNHGLEIVYWNNTAYKLSEMGYREIKMDHAGIHPMTYIFKNARKHIELNLNIAKTKDKVYDSYRFGYSYTTLTLFVRALAEKFLIATHSTPKGLLRIKNAINTKERQTNHYQKSLETLKAEKPDFVFVTNQRQALAIASVLAAKDLGIPTASFIFSWDNLPKATLVLDTDYYIVWSDLMKEQLLFYYPEIESTQVFITGTPQFETHFNKEAMPSRDAFFAAYGLNVNRKYICYSGDDFTTSPDDPQYLDDVAKAVISLNENGRDLGIIFRRCPVDKSARYDVVLEKYRDLITPIDPKWQSYGTSWDAILPMPEDVALLSNTVYHTELVINLGSSMVFDYAVFNKPCAYINYTVPNPIQQGWRIDPIYKYVHFRSMPSKQAVVWLDSSQEIAQKIEEMLHAPNETVNEAKQWFEVVNRYPFDQASQRIMAAFNEIITTRGADELSATNPK
jgi:hypothetical protein